MTITLQITKKYQCHHITIVKYRSHFKLLLYVFKSLHDKAPTYLEELILPYTPGRSLRSENEGILQQPRDVRTESCSWRGVLNTTLCDKVCQ
jgi:hypothetical protein